MNPPTAIFNIFIMAPNTRPYSIKGKEVRELDNMSQDHIVMQDGRVMLLRNGERMPMEEEVQLPDGTRVGVDGTVMMPDGTMRMMDEGETILLQGEPAGAENMSDRQFKETMEDEELRDEMP